MISTLYRPVRASLLAAARARRHRVAELLAAAIVRYCNGAEVTSALASGRLITVATHMADLGADEEMRRRFGSWAGKYIKAAFRARNDGTDPRMVWEVHNSLPIRVCAYEPDDPALTIGLGSYVRTAHLVAA